MTDKEFISEITVRVDDIDFKDFNRSTYERMLLRAKRYVARKYRILNKVYTFELYNDANSKEPVKLNLPEFIGEYRVKVNKVEFLRDENLSMNNTYIIEHFNNEILFNYKPKGNKDLIQIYYTADFSDDETENENIKPILPDEYDEEVISKALVEIAKSGIAKYPDPQSKQFLKYSNILKIYDTVGKKSELIRSEDWIQIQVRGVI